MENRVGVVVHCVVDLFCFLWRWITRVYTDYLVPWVWLEEDIVIKIHGFVLNMFNRYETLNASEIRIDNNKIALEKAANCPVKQLSSVQQWQIETHDCQY